MTGHVKIKVVYTGGNNGNVSALFFEPTPPSITVANVPYLKPNSTTTVNVVGFNTNWVNGTTTFSFGGVTGASAGTTTVTDATHASFPVTTGSTTGTGTISDNTDTATAALQVATGIAYTSVASGNWSSGSTWSPAYVPGGGDTVTVNNAVTVDQDTAVGSSPSDTTTLAVSVASGGSLTVASGKTLTVRGNMTVNNTGSGGTVDLKAGASLTFDASQATTTSTNYIFTLGVSSTSATLLQCEGTVSSPCNVSSNAAGGNAGIFGGSANDSGLIHATYTTFQRIGTASTPSDNAVLLNSTLSLDHCTFDGCGKLTFSQQIGASANLTITNCTWRNTLSGSCFGGSNAPSSVTGTRTLSGCVFDQQASPPTAGLTCSGNLFLASCAAGGSNYGGTFSNNFVRYADGDNSASMSWGTGQGGLARVCNWSGDYLVVDDNTYDGAGHYTTLTDAANPHWTHFGTTGTLTVDHCVFESFGSDGTGDIDYGPNATGYNSVFTYNLILPDQESNANGFLNSGTLTTNNGWSGEASVYEHNTFYSGSQGPLALAEGGNGFANMVSSYRDNLIWNDPRNVGAGFNFLAYYPTSPAGAVTDMITPANCDYNAGWNVNSTGTRNGNGHYNILESSTVGAHDVYTNPSFVDSTRNFAGWVRSLVGGTLPGNSAPTTHDYDAWGLHLLSLVNTPGAADYNAGATVSSLKAWVRAGFTPRASALKAAAHDGTDIGAVAVNSAQLLFRRLNGMRSGSRTSY